MQVLMYGWEFPPRISGGLGVACHAIVKELIKKNIELTLILPKTTENDIDNLVLIDSDDACELNAGEFGGYIDIQYQKITTHLSPYFVTKDCKQIFAHEALQDIVLFLSNMHVPEELRAMVDVVNTNENCDKYGSNLLVEVFRYAMHAGALAKNTAHDVIYAHDWLTVLAALEAKRHSAKPVILHMHALETDRSGIWVDKRIFAIEKYGMEQADQIIAVSQFTKNNIVRYYNIPAEKITVVHNGIYCDANVEEKAKNNKNQKMVLFLGRITHQKGPRFFVEVAARILEKRDDVQFVLAGTGDLLPEIIELTAGLRIGKNVHFTGFLDSEHVSKIYNLADVYVMPSVSEPFGLSALEALSHNVPAIITKQSGVAEVLGHTLISDFWDVDDIAAKILALLDCPVLRKTVLTDTKKELHELTWASTAERIIEVYKKAMLE